MVTLTNTNGYFGAKAGTALEYDFSEIGWSDSGDASIDVGADILIAGGGIRFGGTYAVELGLTGLAHLDLGHMDTSMGIDGSAAAIAKIGTGATFDSTKIAISDFTVEASGPDAAESFIELGFHAGLKIDGKLEAYAWYDVGFDSGETSGTIYEGNLVDSSVDLTLIPHTTLDVLGGLDGNILTVALGDYVEAKIDLPDFTYDDPEYNAVEGKPDQVVIHGESSPFATVEFGLASFLGLGPWGESVELGFIEAGVEVGLFDAKLVAEATLVQDITIDSEIGFSMTTTLNDDVITGTMGDIVDFKTPEGEGDFEVTVDYTLFETVDSTLSLKLNSAIDWKLLFGAAYIAIPDISEKLEFELAAADGRVDLGELLGLSIAFELTHDVTLYISDAGTETYSVHYENFVTAASGALMALTTNQVLALGGRIANEILGNALDNQLLGAGGNDSLYGHDGADRLNGGRGDDLMDGGAGIDTAVFIGATHGVTVDLGLGEAHGFGTDTLVGIENVTGSNADDRIYGDAGDNVLRGMNGGDWIDAGAGNDLVDGGNGSDNLVGGDGIDTLTYASEVIGGISMVLGEDAWVSDGFFIDVVSGFENVTGSTFADTITGSAGDNVLRGGLGNDILDGAEGNDTVQGGKGDDVLSGGAGNDKVGGGEGADQLDGGSGSDTLTGFYGGDTLDGGDGFDFASYEGGTYGVVVYLDGTVVSGADAAGDVLTNIEGVIGTTDGDYLGGDAGDNILIGNAGGDYLYGNGGNDTLYGGDGVDGLYGGEGNDALYSGSTPSLSVTEWNENMDGGAGDDTFYFNGGRVQVIGDDGIDTIVFAGALQDYRIFFDGYRVHVTTAAGDDLSYGTSTEYLSFTNGDHWAGNFYP